MIVGKKITKCFGDNVLFRDFDFKIDDGEFVCFSGASGKGKTTLLNMIGLIEPVDSGEIWIDGRQYLTNKEKLEYYRTKAGFLFQNFALIENKTVEQNLDLVREDSRTGHSIEEVLDMVGLENKLDSKVYTLSGGEQQRIALARLFLKKCDIVLADEPTGSLDAANADIVMGILGRLNDEGRTVIMVTHDARIKSMAQRVIEL